MGKVAHALGWFGIIAAGLINGVLEDMLFISILVPYMPPSLDLTGELFWIFTVPLAQLLALAITGSVAWFFLNLRRLPRLMVFWFAWLTARVTFLSLLNNPLEDIFIYAFWLTFWCALIGIAVVVKGRNQALNS